MHDQRRRVASLLLSVSVVLMWVLPLAAQPMVVVEPATFRTNGSPIAGWHWCRAEEQFLDWEWTPVAEDSPSVAAVNFSLLVTNRANGGSGYGAVVNLAVYVSGEIIEYGVLHLVNPFLPQMAGDTGGIGYHVYGAYQFQKPDLILHGFRIRIAWPPACPATYHFAGNEESALLAYVR